MYVGVNIAAINDINDISDQLFTYPGASSSWHEYDLS